MLVLVIVEGVAIVLLAVLVVGLLRSHAEILRALHDLGVKVGSSDDSTLASAPRSALPAEPIRTQPGVPAPRTTTTAGHDVAGITPAGRSALVGVVGAEHTTLLAFLSSGCSTCLAFWEALADPDLRLPGNGTRLVIVTQGPDDESESAVQRLAPDEITTVMSNRAWSLYEVPVAPYFILVDGPSGQVLGEGAAATWEQVATLLEQACADVGLRTDGRPLGSRRQRGLRQAEREDRADRELLAAGIVPGHPSLHPPVRTEDAGDERSVDHGDNGEAVSEEAEV